MRRFVCFVLVPASALGGTCDEYCPVSVEGEVEPLPQPTSDARLLASSASSASDVRSKGSSTCRLAGALCFICVGTPALVFGLAKASPQKVVQKTALKGWLHSVSDDPLIESVLLGRNKSDAMLSELAAVWTVAKGDDEACVEGYFSSEVCEDRERTSFDLRPDLQIENSSNVLERISVFHGWLQKECAECQLFQPTKFWFLDAVGSRTAVHKKFSLWDVVFGATGIVVKTELGDIASGCEIASLELAAAAKAGVEKIVLEANTARDRDRKLFAGKANFLAPEISGDVYLLSLLKPRLSLAEVEMIAESDPLDLTSPAPFLHQVATDDARGFLDEALFHAQRLHVAGLLEVPAMQKEIQILEPQESSWNMVTRLWPKVYIQGRGAEMIRALEVWTAAVELGNDRCRCVAEIKKGLKRICESRRE